MTQSLNAPKVQFEDKPTTPIFTFALILALIGAFAACQMGRPEWWLSHNCFQELAFIDLFKHKDFQSMALKATVGTFASWKILQMALNIYFVWVFCKHVENKLGPGRFLLLLIVALYAPWVATYFNLYGKSANLETYMIGPAMFLCTIIGTYMVFPPVPVSKMGSGNIKDRNQIFRKDERANPLDKYTANPYMFIGVFTAFQILMHLWMCIGLPNVSFLEPMKGYDVGDLIGAIVSVAIGFALGQLFLQSATASFKEGPLTMEALRRYHELIDLDVKHDDALKGTARTLGLPYEKVREWVAKNKGKLRVK